MIIRSNSSDEMTYVLSKADITCPISGEIFFDPTMVNPCGHLFEDELIEKWIKKNNTCPCCREVIIDLNEPPPFFNHFFQQLLTQNPFLHEERYFSFNFLINCLNNTDFSTELDKIIILFKNSPKHLNMICQEEGEYKGLTPVYLLTKFIQGKRLLIDHPLLRDNISRESLNMINQSEEHKGLSAAYWLTASRKGRELLLEDARLRSLISKETYSTMVEAPGSHFLKSPLYWLQRVSSGQEILKKDSELCKKLGIKSNGITFSIFNIEEASTVKLPHSSFTKQRQRT